MANIDPSGNIPTPGVAPIPTTNDIDQGVLVQALALQQTTVLQNALAASLPKISQQAELYGKVAAVGAQLSAANKVAKDRELNSIDAAANSLNETPVHERDSVEVTAADNERFEQLNQWAADRDLQLKSGTKTIPAPSQLEIDTEATTAGRNARNQALADGKDAKEAEKIGYEAEQRVREEMGKIQPKTVIDVDNIAYNKKVIADYRAEVEAGTADNKALQESISAIVKELGIDKTLQELGVSASLNTLQDLKNQSDSMLNWAVSIVKDLTKKLAEAKAEAAELGEAYLQFDRDQDFAALLDSDRDKAKALQSALERAAEKLDELKRGDAAQTADKIREALADLSGGVEHAEQIAQTLEDHSEHTESILAGASETGREWVDNQLSSWQESREQQALAQDAGSTARSLHLGRQRV